jgi:hypothetical protein
MNYVALFLRENEQPCTANDFCLANYGLSWKQVRDGDYPEWRQEVLDAIEAGEVSVPAKIPTKVVQ